jgi:hypothetical protein
VWALALALVAGGAGVLAAARRRTATGRGSHR